MANEHMKNTLRHKFDAMTSPFQFMLEARKVESEFAAGTVKVHQ